MDHGRAFRGATRSPRPSPAPALLTLSGIAKTIVAYQRGQTIFAQGDSGAEVLYIKTGDVRLSVLRKSGGESVVATLGPGDFFGEGCLAGQPVRLVSATALTPCEILLFGKKKMVRLLHEQHAMSDRLVSHMLARGVRNEEHLIDQLFNLGEKRLAKTLMLLAQSGKHDRPAPAGQRMPEPLPDVAGPAHSRVHFFLNRFKRFGFIEYRGEHQLKINSWLLSVVLHDRSIRENHVGRWWI